jgi:Zn-finger nucleic acid-binding protein
VCGGIWFDEQELPRLLHVTRQELSPLRGGATLDDLNSKRGSCPREGTALLRVYSAQNPAVVVDACTQCRGIWLDGGEFDRLLS